MSSKANEHRIAKLYGVTEELELTQDNRAMFPTGMTVGDLKIYIEHMIADNQPRYLRVEDRPSIDIKDYNIPFNYFVVESNTVPFISSLGSIYYQNNSTSETADEEEEEQEYSLDHDHLNSQQEEDEEEMFVKDTRGKRDVIITSNQNTNTKQDVPNPNLVRQLNSRDYGEMICCHIFNNGRKTMDELVKELKGIEIHLMTLLVHKMVKDGYLQLWKDKEKDEKTGEEKEIETLELVSHKKLEEKKDGTVY